MNQAKSGNGKKQDMAVLGMILMGTFIIVVVGVLLLNWFFNPSFKSGILGIVKGVSGYGHGVIGRFYGPQGSEGTVFNREYNLLILGIDSKTMEENTRSDAIIILHIDPRRGWIGGLSIPRDTLATLPNGERTKINHAYALGGIDMAKPAFQDLLKIKIDRYLVMNFEGFEKVVDMIGGIDLVIEKNMRYRDRRAGLNINLKVQRDAEGNPMVQHLDGEQAMGYMRFRHDVEGDFGRVKRHQEFLKALFDAVIHHAQIPDLLQLINEYGSGKLLLTDLTPSEIQDLQGLLKKMQSEPNKYKMVNVALTGAPVDFHRMSCVEIDQEMMYNAVQALFYNGYNPSHENITVKILNACGMPARAEKFTEYLGFFGYKTLPPENAETKQDNTTLMIYNSGLKPDDLKNLLNADVQYAPRPEGQTQDVTAVIGRTLCNHQEGN